jgi:hypothetical protein
VNFTPEQTAAMLAGTSFAAGLNVYATVATLGLLSRTGLIALPSALDPMRSWWIIGVCLALFALEFFADKVPAFDLIWNALQTFVRIPVAAFIAYVASSHLSPGMQLVSALVGGAIAFAAHGGKTAFARRGDTIAGAVFKYGIELRRRCGSDHAVVGRGAASVRRRGDRRGFVGGCGVCDALGDSRNSWIIYQDT